MAPVTLPASEQLMMMVFAARAFGGRCAVLTGRAGKTQRGRQGRCGQPGLSARAPQPVLEYRGREGVLTHGAPFVSQFNIRDGAVLGLRGWRRSRSTGS